MSENEIPASGPSWVQVAETVGWTAELQDDGPLSGTLLTKGGHSLKLYADGEVEYFPPNGAHPQLIINAGDLLRLIIRGPASKAWTVE